MNYEISDSLFVYKNKSIHLHKLVFLFLSDQWQKKFILKDSSQWNRITWVNGLGQAKRLRLCLDFLAAEFLNKQPAAVLTQRIASYTSLGLHTDLFSCSSPSCHPCCSSFWGHFSVRAALCCRSVFELGREERTDVDVDMARPMWFQFFFSFFCLF